jgi:hypothetical protein
VQPEEGEERLAQDWAWVSTPPFVWVG